MKLSELRIGDIFRHFYFTGSTPTDWYFRSMTDGKEVVFNEAETLDLINPQPVTPVSNDTEDKV